MYSLLNSSEKYLHAMLKPQFPPSPNGIDHILILGSKEEEEEESEDITTADSWTMPTIHLKRLHTNICIFWRLGKKIELYEHYAQK